MDLVRTPRGPRSYSSRTSFVLVAEYLRTPRAPLGVFGVPPDANGRRGREGAFHNCKFAISVKSRFWKLSAVCDASCCITWSPDLNSNGVERIYTIWGKENLTDAAWHSHTNAAIISDICIMGKVDGADNGLMVQLRGSLAQQLAVLVAVEESVHGCLPFLLSELPRICDSSKVKVALT